MKIRKASLYACQIFGSKKRKEKAKFYLVFCKPTTLICNRTVTRQTALHILFRHGNFKVSQRDRFRRMEIIVVQYMRKIALRSRSMLLEMKLTIISVLHANRSLLRKCTFQTEIKGVGCFKNYILRT